MQAENTTVQNYKKFSWLFLIIASICLFNAGTLLYIFTTQKSELNFEKYVVDPITQEAHNEIQKAHELIKQFKDLYDNQEMEGRSVSVVRYNKLVSDYNALSQSIPRLKFFEKSPLMRNEIIQINNNSFQFIDLVKQSVSNSQFKKQNNIAQEHLLSYEKYLQKISTPESFFNYNPTTLVFLSSIASLVFLSLCLSILFLLQSRTQLNLIYQKESKIQTFLNIINNMSEGVVVTNKYGFFTYFNKSALDIIGPHIKDIHYQSSIDLMGFYDLNKQALNKEQLPFQSALKKEIVTDLELLVKNSQNPNGIYISASNGFFVNEKAEVVGSVVVMKNITHKKQLEALWLKEKENALEGSKKKSDFLASMSHEIRTPMNGIIGLTTLLNETHLNHDQKDYVGTIKRSALSLLDLINDILDHSKIEAGKIELRPKPFHLHELIKDVVENFKPLCEEKNIELRSQCPQDLTLFYKADANRIRQILMNLLGNAVKFTQKGFVEISILPIQTTAQSDLLRFTVTDSGVGMEKNEVQKLFQKYFQTKSGLQFGGTGLGLSISKQLIELMGGSIQVDSTAGVGTQFWFEIQLEKTTQKVVESNVINFKNQENKFKGRILVAEDNNVNQKVAFQYLTRLGFSVDIAKNGVEAVQHYKKDRYDLVFMDCQMPLKNGYAATKEILQYIDQNQLPHTPIVALTAEGTSGEKKKCFDSGMTDFLNKPIILEDLVSLLNKYFKADINIKTIPEEMSKIQNIKVGDQLLLEVLFEEFQNSTPTIIQDIKKSMLQHDYPTISEQAHALKSASATLGAIEMSDICRKLENFSTSQPFVELEALVDSLEKKYTDTVNTIRKNIEVIKNQTDNNLRDVA